MATGPRANFSCQHCGKLAGTEPVKIEDLPVGCTRCPICNYKRGFVRLFDALGGVISSKTNNVSKLAAEVLEPLYAEHSTRKAGAERFERAGKDAIDRSIHEASTADRAKQTPFGATIIPAKAAMGAIPPEARQASRELTYPATKRYVTPQWTDGKKS